MSKNDDWPERIAIPAVKDSIKMLRWIEECLWSGEERQLSAQKQIRLAVDELHRAVETLERG